MGTPAQLLERALALAQACERPDLRRRLLQARARSADPRVRVLVVGEPKQGKSSLVNGLVGAPVCPVADEVAARVTGEGTDRLVQAEVELPRRLLDGLELVDTAGVGGVGAQRALRTVDLLPTADAVLVVSDASQEFTAPEMAFLEQAAALWCTTSGRSPSTSPWRCAPSWPAWRTPPRATRWSAGSRTPGPPPTTCAAARRAGSKCSPTVSPTSWPTSTSTCATAPGS